MNNAKMYPLRGQKHDKFRLLLWIIGSIAAIIGAYYSQFGILFHLKSALLTWFSAWFVVFGWILQTWYQSTNDTEKQDFNEGIMTLNNNPLILSDYLILTGIIGMAVNPICLVLWLICSKILIHYHLHQKISLRMFIAENISIKFGKYREGSQQLDILKGIRATTNSAIISVAILLLVLDLRFKAINRELPIEIETVGLVLLLLIIALKIFLSSKRHTDTLK
ncbi:MAG TPA: hypothetical protein PLG57_09155 [Bacteroidia bacterium]|nr:hypothetical protein [Bacteroidia bacterium]